MSNAPLNRRIDPNEPLADASFLLMALYSTLAERAPVAARSTSRHARRFRRSVENAPVVQGATRFFRRSLHNSFAPRASVPQPRNLQVASRFLMAGRPARPGATPQVSVLNLTQARAQYRAVRLAAQRMLGTLRARFAANAADYFIDHRLDTMRMLTARARFARSASGPSFAV
jgi:hypothetical protein